MKLDEKQWEEVEVRETTKGTLKLLIHTVPVWVWMVGNALLLPTLRLRLRVLIGYD